MERCNYMIRTGNILIQNDQPPRSDSEHGFELSYKLKDRERLYGFGDESRNGIQKRGKKTRCLSPNRTSYMPIPFVMSDHGWGLFMNTTMYHSFDAGATIDDRLLFTASRGILDYFLIEGESMPDILDKYTDITGNLTFCQNWDMDSSGFVMNVESGPGMFFMKLMNSEGREYRAM
jgi:alpha-glucosidase (family GH31 glycosyl hydrolase)